MTRIVPFTKNREAIYDLLTRAKRFHATSTSVVELDVTELVQRLGRERDAGRAVGLTACMVKATSLTLARYPRLNHHLFHGLVRKFEVDFEEIVCNLIMTRKQAGELILLPVLIERSNELSLDEIQAVIDHHKRTPLDELPQIQGIQRLKKLPRPVLKLFSYKCRSDPAFYRKYFGTYGLSPLFAEGPGGEPSAEAFAGTATHSVTNTCTGFFPSVVRELPRVVDGRVEPRQVMSMMLALDHYLVDGHDGLMSMRYFERLLSDPARLGLSSEAAPASAAGRR